MAGINIIVIVAEFIRVITASFIDVNDQNVKSTVKVGIKFLLI